jgi:hypothetical protein
MVESTAPALAELACYSKILASGSERARGHVLKRRKAPRGTHTPGITRQGTSNPRQTPEPSLPVRR